MNGKFTSRSKGFKIMSLILAFVLVIGVSVAGTLAWLTAQTPEVKNTFTSAELFDRDDPNEKGDFTLWEHKAVDENADGLYELTTEKVTGNAYTILPGVNIPKNPTVDVDYLEGNAYLYIKVTSTLPTGVSYTLTDDWTALGDNYPGIYVYTGTNANDNKVIEASESSKKTFEVEILSDNQITVATTYNGTGDCDLTFNAYMVQATGNGADAAEAWVNTFGADVDEGASED